MKPGVKKSGKKHYSCTWYSIRQYYYCVATSPMEFRGVAGPSVHVRSTDTGQRLQRFASHAFREQLGRRGSSRLHASCRGTAHQQVFLVNDIPRPGRHVLCAGDVVTLVATTDAEHTAAAGDPSADKPSASTRARMTFGTPSRGAEDSGTLHEKNAFVQYYSSQLPAARWQQVKSAYAALMPLSVRPNASVRSAALAIEAMAQLHGGVMRPVAWLPEACMAPEGTEQPAELVPPTPNIREAQLSELLLQAQACGEVALQEAAAMLPALALAPGLHHRVLDMCAAPGGKSLQLLDIMMGVGDAAASWQTRQAMAAAAAAVKETAGSKQHVWHDGPTEVEESCSATQQEQRLPPPPPPPLQELDFEEQWAAEQLLPRGVLVSNDLQWARQERTLRRASCQPCTPLVVTCGDATNIGRLLNKLPADSGTANSSQWSFDRVLCDVPCTGDGTMRKSPDVLTRWSARHGLRAHSLQVRVPTTAVVRHATLSHAMRPPARHPLARTHTALHCVRTTRPAYQPVQ